MKVSQLGEVSTIDLLTGGVSAAPLSNDATGERKVAAMKRRILAIVPAEIAFEVELVQLPLVP
jgi:hypothetical protein